MGRTLSGQTRGRRGQCIRSQVQAGAASNVGAALRTAWGSGGLAGVSGLYRGAGLAMFRDVISPPPLPLPSRARCRPSGSNCGCIRREGGKVCGACLQVPFFSLNLLLYEQLKLAAIVKAERRAGALGMTDGSLLLSGRRGWGRQESFCLRCWRGKAISFFGVTGEEANFSFLLW